MSSTESSATPLPDPYAGIPPEQRPGAQRDLGRAVYRLRKRATATALGARGRWLSITGHDAPLDNLFFATVQRSGSQWLKQVLADPRIVARSGLAMYPQHRYEWGEFVKRFPRFTFVPGLYMSYDLYEEITKPARYRTIYVVRDPRTIVVSWYWAARDTHSMMGKIIKHRAALQELDLDDGLEYCIRALATRFADMRTWADNAADPNVLLVRFEDLTADPATGLRAILDHCDIVVPEPELAAVITDYDREQMRRRDLERREPGRESHYRARGSDHREAFRARHYESFRRVAGDLAETLGYEPAPADGGNHSSMSS